jgi:hypothetical protein
MIPWEEILIICPGWERLPGAYNSIAASLPIEIRKRMTEVMISYVTRFGPQGVFERMNNRTISRILSEFDNERGACVESGELEGLRYELYDRPSSDLRPTDE